MPSIPPQRKLSRKGGLAKIGWRTWSVAPVRVCEKNVPGYTSDAFIAAVGATSPPPSSVTEQPTNVRPVPRLKREVTENRLAYWRKGLRGSGQA